MIYKYHLIFIFSISYFFPLLLPFIHQFPPLSNSVPLGPPRNSLPGLWLSDSPGYKSVLVKFTSKLNSPVLKTKLSVFSQVLAMFDHLLHKLALSICSFWSEAQISSQAQTLKMNLVSFLLSHPLHPGRLPPPTLEIWSSQRLVVHQDLIQIKYP